jgi:hypothetical protein
LDSAGTEEAAAPPSPTANPQRDDILVATAVRAGTAVHHFMRTTQRSSSNIPQGSILLNGELVSEETLQKRAEPVKKKGKPWWMQLVTQHYLWIWLLGAGGIGALVSPHFKAIDPYAPWLNELIHGNVTDQKDVEYQEFKFWKSRDAFAKARALCSDVTNLQKCGAMQSEEPVLIDMSNRLGKLRTAWQRAAYEPEAEATCQADGDAAFTAAEQYIADEQQIVDFISKDDLQTDQGRTTLRQQLSQFQPQEQVSTAKMHDLSLWPKSCPVLSHH